MPFANGGADAESLGGAATGGGSNTIGDSPWRRTPSVRRSKSQPRVTTGANEQSA